MRLFSRYHKKSIGIFGLGATGTSVYKILSNVSRSILCYDDSEDIISNFKTKFPLANVINITDPRWREVDFFVVSPGISHFHDIFTLAKKYNIKIKSDIELFIEENENAEFILVTGTNGKTTVVSLVGHILNRAELDYHIGGNIGKPVMDLPYNRQGYVLELSSFQIELLNHIEAKISIITNITPDHLDRYKNLEEYISAKEKLLSSEGLKIIGVNSKISTNIYDKYRLIFGSKIIPISTNNDFKNAIICKDEYLDDNYFDQKKYIVKNTPALQGEHNRENIAISYAITRALGVNGDFIIDSLPSFKGLEHRMRYVGSWNQIDFYNDSKATNSAAAAKAIANFDDIFWFAGGKLKEKNLEVIQPVLKNIRKAYLFGESKKLLADFLRHNKVQYELCEDLQTAFKNALNDSAYYETKLTFLLSPACASYDQFNNFTERGDLFCNLVKKI